jgi:FkbM family methyltransferase
VSYSQTEEERHILSAVRGVDCGRFLDVGAFHPKNLSNTRALFESGWSGVMVEPSPGPMLSLMLEYGDEDRISLMAGAVGVQKAITRFDVTSDALTTSSKDNYERWKDQGGFYGSFFVPMVTFPEIIRQFGEFDFVSIDAEGTSVDLLHGLLATEMLPVCLCVEYDARGRECMDLAAKHGYHAIYTSSENIVFTR